MKDFINDKLKTRREVYLKDSNIILEDYRKEREKIEEYDGRQLFEMLQNADDEAITEKGKTCFIKWKNRSYRPPFTVFVRPCFTGCKRPPLS